MSRQVIVLVVALCLAGCVVTEAGGAGPRTRLPSRRSRHDLALGVRHTLRLTRTPEGAYRLEEVGVQSMRLLSRRATRQRQLVVAHPYTAPTPPPQAWVAGKRVAPSALTHRVAEQRDVFLSDFKFYQIDLGRPRVGDKVKLRFERRYLDLAFMPVFYLPNVDYLRRYELIIEHPPDIEVSFRTFYPRSPLRPRIDRLGGRTRLRLDNIPRLEALPLFAHNGYRAAFWPALHDGRATLLPDSPARFGAWYRAAAARVLGGISPSVFRQAKALLRGAGSARDKLQRLYDFTRREVRYVADERGINAWVPRSAGMVLDRRYGDCKDKAFLLQQLARAAGLTVELVFVGVEAVAELPGVRLEMFDHAIARWEAPDGRHIYLDATCAPCEFGNWPESIVQKVALVLGAKQSLLLRIPAPPRKPSLEVVVTADIAHPEAARARLVLRNELHWGTLGWQKTSGAPQPSLLSKLIGRRVRDIVFTDFVMERSTVSESVLTARADLSHYVLRDQQQSYLPRAPLVLVPTRLFDRVGDRWPVTVDQREEIDFELHLRAPGYRSADLGRSRMAAAGVEYLSELSSTANGFRARYRYRQRFKHFAGKRRAAYLSFCRRYRQSRRNLYELRRTAAKTSL